MLKRIPPFLRNRYTITGLAFVVWLVFLDSFDIPTLKANIDKRNEKQTEKVRLQQEIEDTRRAYLELTSDPAMLEKFARENYLMKKEGEDVFVIVEAQPEEEN